MKDICLIPCWRRPEFLHFCLQKISQAEGASDIKYLFKVDSGYDHDILHVISKFSENFETEIQQQPRTGYTLAKQSLNVLTGYLMAAEMSNRLVYMVEEDIMVATDFFKWHQKIHELEEDNLFCSIATSNNNTKVATTGNLDEYYLMHGDYQSLGVCFDKRMIIRHILQHCSSAYYSNPMGYCTASFPMSRIGRAFAEQDGLIRRIQEHQDKPVAFPHHARAFHSGFYGKNRGKMFNQSLRWKIDYIQSIIFSDAAMKSANAHPHLYEDSRPIELVNPPLDYKLLYISVNP